MDRRQFVSRIGAGSAVLIPGAVAASAVAAAPALPKFKLVEREPLPGAQIVRKPGEKALFPWEFNRAYDMFVNGELIDTRYIYNIDGIWGWNTFEEAIHNYFKLAQIKLIELEVVRHFPLIA